MVPTSVSVVWSGWRRTLNLPGTRRTVNWSGSSRTLQSLEEFPEQRSQPARDAAKSTGADRPRRLTGLIAMRVHHEPHGRRERGVVHVIRQATETRRSPTTYGQIEDLV